MPAQDTYVDESREYIKSGGKENKETSQGNICHTSSKFC